mgnify:CR=1 FL=1
MHFILENILICNHHIKTNPQLPVVLSATTNRTEKSISYIFGNQDF